MLTGGRFNSQPINMQVVAERYLPAIQRGMHFAAADQFKQAEAEFADVMQHAPAIFIANFAYHLLLDRLPLAHPRRSFVHTCLGRAYLELNKIPQARIALDCAIQADAENAAAYFYRGCVNQQKDAISDFNKALELDPALGPKIYLRRAQVYSCLPHGEYSTLLDYQQAAKYIPQELNKMLQGVDPSQPIDFTLRIADGFLQYYMGNFSDAARCFAEVLLQEIPNPPKYTFEIREILAEWLLKCCLEKDAYDIAINAFSLLLKSMERFRLHYNYQLCELNGLQYLINRAHGYLAQHKTNEADKDFLAMKSAHASIPLREPKLRPAYLNRYLGFHALVTANYNEAVKHLVGAYSEDKHDAITLIGLVSLAVNDEDIRLGYDAMNEFLQHHPHSNVGHYLRGRLASVKGSVDIATADFTAVLDSISAHSRQKLASALELYRLGQLQNVTVPPLPSAAASAAAMGPTPPPTITLDTFIDFCKYDNDANSQYLCAAAFAAMRQYDRANVHLTKVLTQYMPTNINIVHRQGLFELLVQPWCWPTTKMDTIKSPCPQAMRDEWARLLKPNSSDKTRLRKAKLNLYLQRFLPGTSAECLLPVAKVNSAVFSFFDNKKESYEEINDAKLEEISEDTKQALRNASKDPDFFQQLHTNHSTIYTILTNTLEAEFKPLLAANNSHPQTDTPFSFFTTVTPQLASSMAPKNKGTIPEWSAESERNCGL